MLTMGFASVYPLYIGKAEKKGRKKSEVDAVICWLTGYSQQELEGQLKKQTDFETFFKEAPKLNPSRTLIKGVILWLQVSFGPLIWRAKPTQVAAEETHRLFSVRGR